MSKQYTSSTVLRESRPRSRRLLGLGRSAAGTVMSSVLPDNAWSELFELVVIQSGGEESYAIRAKYALYSDDEIAAGGVLTPGTDPGGVSYLRSLADVYHSDSVVLRSDGQTAAQDGDVLAYDATNQRWYAKPSGEGGVSAYSDLSGKPSINDHVLASGNNTLATLGIAAAGHTHSGYAASNHNHDSVYAAKNHTHDEYLTEEDLSLAEVAYSGIAAAVEDYTSATHSIKIGYYGASLSSANYFAMYAEVNNQPVIKDMAISDVKDLLDIPSSYSDLSGKPSINGQTITAGNNTLATLGIAAANHTHSGYAASNHNHDSVYAAKNHTHSDYLTLSGIGSADVTVKSLTIPSNTIDGFLKIGQAYLWYDDANDALCVSGSNGSAMAFYATGDIGAGGSADGSGAFTWTPVLSSGVEIARLSINGGSPISVYAPSGGGGVSSYSDLSSKPSINGHTLFSGNNTLSTLGIAAASHTHSGYAASNHNHDGAYAAKNHTHNDYLPLSAGSSKPLEDDLYLGSHRIYFDSTHYLEYDSTNGCFHFSADVYAAGDVAASS